MKHELIETSDWLDLSDAARFLGVHFTTLRRWATHGDIKFIRTPGGHRRFNRHELEKFLECKRQPQGLDPAHKITLHPQDGTLCSLQALTAETEFWLPKLSLEQREYLRHTGNRLAALLIEYATHPATAEAELEEARIIGKSYGQVCAHSGITLLQTIKIFLFFQRTILRLLHENKEITRVNSKEGHQNMQRSFFFMEQLLLTMTHGYTQFQELDSF